MGETEKHSDLWVSDPRGFLERQGEHNDSQAHRSSMEWQHLRAQGDPEGGDEGRPPVGTNCLDPWSAGVIDTPEDAWDEAEDV